MREQWDQGLREHREFWQYAHVSEWDEVANRLDDNMRNNIVNVLTGPRGIGKSNQLLPRLAQMAEADGRQALVMTNLRPARLIEAIAAHRDKPITLLLDEPDNLTFSGTALVIADLIRSKDYDIHMSVVIGAIDDAKTRYATVKRVYTDELELAGLKVIHEELQSLPLIDIASIKAWAEKTGAEPALVDFIARQPYLRIPRVFDAIMHGVIIHPDYDPDTDDPANDAHLLYNNLGLTQQYPRALGEYRAPRRAHPRPKRLNELIDTLLAEHYDTNSDPDAYGRRIWIDAIASMTGAHKDKSYQYYQQLCEVLGLQPVAENKLYTPTF